MCKVTYTQGQNNVLQLPLSVALRADANFNNFHVDTNALLINKIQEQIEIPNNESAIFLWGERAAGKTHLLQAACDKASSLKRSSTYIPLSVAAELDVAMLEGLESYNVICVDDIDLIAENLQWEKALFELYNRAQENQSLMIFSSTKSIKEMQLTLADLSSRLSWGFVFQLQSLTDEEKPVALQLHAKARGFDLPDNVVAYLLKHYPRDMAELSKILDDLDKATLMAKRKITIPFVKECLSPTQS